MMKSRMLNNNDDNDNENDLFFGWTTNGEVGEGQITVE